MKKLLLGLFALAVGQVFAANNLVFIPDSTAGEANQVRISGLTADEIVQVDLIRPDETTITFNQRADDLGSLDFYLRGLHLERSGAYELSVQRSFFPADSIIANFDVLPGPVSAYRSKIEVKKASLPADGEAESEFMVYLKDAFGNPVSNQFVKIFSSRNSDVVVAEKISDEGGITRGKLKSDTSGVSVLTVLAGETVVFDRPEVVFYLSDTTMKNIGASDNFGDFLKAQLFEETFGDVAYFSVEELPHTVEVDEVTTVLISAKDENGEIVRDYTGRIRFSSSDGRARIPSDYQFDLDDQGTHRFSLAVTFGTVGQHTLAVHDLNDFRINGEAAVNVTKGGRGLEINNNDGITIEVPEPGRYNLSRVTISGKAFGTPSIKIVDGPTLLIDELSVDQETGDYMFQTPNLAEGVHKFQVMSLDEELKSEEVMIRIDRTPPTVMAVEVIPDGALEPSQGIQLKVSLSEPISAARCSFEETTAELINAGNYFIGDTVVPERCGRYPVSCTIADLLGNDFTEPRAATLQVCATQVDTDEDGLYDEEESGDDDGDCVENKYESIVIDSNGNGVVDQLDPENDSDDGGVVNFQECTVDGTDPLDPLDDQISDAPPTAIMNLTAEPGEKKVTLFWSPAKDDIEIWKYRIEFGTDSEFLIQENTTPDNRTQWYVDGLEEATTYYFSVIAIDIDGFEGPPSRTVQATTFGAEEPIHPSADVELDKTGGGGVLSSFIVLGVALFVGAGILVLRRV